MVTVASVRGSAPREAGAKMIVTAATVLGTIGGGHLEYKAIAIARDQLAAGNSATVRRFPLGASLGQCCGGVVNLLFEAVPVAARGATRWPRGLVAGWRRSWLPRRMSRLHRAAAGRRRLGVRHPRGGGLDRRAIAAAREMAAGGPPTLGRFERDDGNLAAVPRSAGTAGLQSVRVRRRACGTGAGNSLAALPCRITWWTSGPRRFRRRCPTT